MARPKVEIDPKRGLRVKQILQEQGMTQQELADRINIAVTNLSAMLNGKMNVTETRAQQISKVFAGEYSVEWIMGFDKHQNAYELESWQRLNALQSEQAVKNLLRRNKYFVDLPNTVLIEEPDNPDHCQRVPVRDGTVTIQKEGKQLTLTFAEYQEFCNEIYDYVDFRVNQLLKKRGGAPSDT